MQQQQQHPRKQFYAKLLALTVLCLLISCTKPKHPGVFDPSWKDQDNVSQDGSGLSVYTIQVALLDKKGNEVLPKIPLNECSWLRIEINPGKRPEATKYIDPRDPTLQGLVFHSVIFHLVPGTKPKGSRWVLRLWGTDMAGNWIADTTYGSPVDHPTKLTQE